MTQKITSVNIETNTLNSISGPTISSIGIANSTYVLLDDTAVSNAGGYAVITGTNFTSGAQVLFGSTPATAVTFVNSTTLNVEVPALTVGSYVTYVQNGDGSTAIILNGITSSPIPVWATGSTLANQQVDTAISISLSASSDSSVTFSVANGSSLPSGTTLASNGLFSGTITGISSQTTYNFSVNAIDTENQEALRSFSVTVSVGDPYFNLTALLLSGNGNDGANNQIFIDSSNNNFAITRSGNATQGTFTPFSQTGWSNYFDGTGDSLSVPNNVSLNPGTSDFVMEAWVYVANTTGVNQGINGKGTAGTDGYSMFLTNGLVLSFIWNGTGGTTITAGTLTRDTWNHVAVVRNSNVIRLYLNGTGGSSAACTTDITSTAIKYVGQARGSNPLLGFMSNYRMMKGSRPSGYDATSSTLTPPTETLTAVANTTLLTCQSNRFVDNSANNFTITRNGDITVQSFSPFAPNAAYSISTVGGSAYFDGTADFLDLPSNSAFTIGTSDFTIEGYVYLISGTTGTLYDSRTGPTTVSPVIYLNAGVLTYFVGANRISGPTLVAGQWHHIAVSRSGTSTKLFLNGVQVGLTYTDTNNYVIGGPKIGAGQTTANQLNGYISALRLEKGSALYTSNTAPPTGPLTSTANTQLLLNFTNAAIIDSTSKNILETFNQAQANTSIKKYGSGSMYFDGTDDALVMPYSPIFNLGTGQFTIECWVNFSALTTSRIIFDTYTAASAGGGYQLYWRATGTSIAFYANGGVQAQSSFTTHAVDTWYHVAVTRDSSGIVRIFVDGVMYAYTSYTAAIDIATTARPAVGIQFSTSTNEIQGYIDDLRVTKGFARYSSNTSFTPPTSQFLAL